MRLLCLLLLKGKGVLFLPFNQNIKHMQGLSKNASDQTKYSNSFSPSPSELPDLKLLYPGKLTKGDYRLELDGHALSHTDIVKAVHDCTIAGNGAQITNILANVYVNGLNANTNYHFSITVANTKLSISKFKELVYWLVLQEDINYPRPRYMGVKMPIIRYIEGAIAAEQPTLLSLQDVYTRTNNHGGPPPQAFDHQNLHQHFKDSLAQVA